MATKEEDLAKIEERIAYWKNVRATTDDPDVQFEADLNISHWSYARKHAGTYTYQSIEKDVQAKTLARQRGQRHRRELIEQGAQPEQVYRGGISGASPKKEVIVGKEKVEEYKSKTTPQAYVQTKPQQMLVAPQPTQSDPTWQEPTGFFGKSWWGIKSLWAATPFGRDILMPREYHEKRSRWSFMDPRDAFKGMVAQEVKVKKAEQQVGKIEAFKMKVEAAPEEDKYATYQAGKTQLEKEGVYMRPSLTEKDTMTFSSKELRPSTSWYAYRLEREKNPIAKGMLLTSAGSTEAVKWYGAGKIIGLGVKGATALKLGSAAKAVAPTAKAFSYIKPAATGGLIRAGVYGLGGAAITYGSYKEYQGLQTPEQKQVFWAKKAGMAAGIGALATESYLRGKAISKYNIKARADYSLKTQRFQHLKNIKTSGQYTKYATYSYRQAGFGKDLRPQVQRSLSKQSGLPVKKIGEASLWRQQMRVSSPVGFKTYKTGRWGITIAEKGKQSVGWTFSQYKGKPTNIEYMFTRQQGQYALTRVYKPSTKGIKLKADYITKLKGYKGFKIGDMKVSAYGSTTRFIPQGMKATGAADLYKRLTPTRNVRAFVSRRIEAPHYRGGVAIKGDYKFTAKGVGKGGVSTKNIYWEKGKPVIKKGGMKFDAWKETAPAIKPAKPSTKLKTPSIKTRSVVIQKQDIQPTIPTTKMGRLRAPTLSLMAQRYDLTAGTIGLMGLSSKPALKLATPTRMKTIQAPVITTTPYQPTTTKQAPRLKAPTTTITPPVSPPITTPTYSPPYTPPTKTPPLTPIPAWSFGGITGGLGFKKIATKRVKGYTPSYTALAFGIKGKKLQKPYYTGLEFRPVSPSWTKPFRSKRSKRKMKLFM